MFTWIGIQLGTVSFHQTKLSRERERESEGEREREREREREKDRETERETEGERESFLPSWCMTKLLQLVMGKMVTSCV